jgi:hypothetical protein
MATIKSRIFDSIWHLVIYARFAEGTKDYETCRRVLEETDVLLGMLLDDNDLNRFDAKLTELAASNGPYLAALRPPEGPHGC